MKIRSIELSPPFALAPMAGMTDTAFRRLVKRKGGCGLVVSEMVSSEGLVRGIDRTLEYAEYTEEERPVSIQIFGGDPEKMAAAAQIVEGIGADIVDVNMKACELVGVSRRTIYNWIASGKVEYVRTAGGSVRIFVDTLWREPGRTHELTTKEASCWFHYRRDSHGGRRLLARQGALWIRVLVTPRSFAPRTPLHARSRGPHTPRSARVGSLARSFATVVRGC